MTGWEIAVLVLAAVAAAASVAALAVSVYASKKGGADVDTLNDVRKMIDESADDREEAILREITSAKDFISKTQSDANNVVAAAIDSNLKGNRESINMLIGDVRENMKQLREEQTRNMDKIDTGMEKDFDKLREELKRALTEMRGDLRMQYAETRKELKDGVDGMRREMSDNLGKVRQDNSVQLEKIRETVDEKLSKTLDERLKTSFEVVRGELDTVNKNLQEMQKLGDNVKDINKVFSGVKTRGTWGETALAALLEELLDKSQYEEQFRVKGQNRVDFAVKMPGRDGGEVYLPIDSKFPVENFERLVTAQNAGAFAEADEARKALKNDLLFQARSIRDKYISQPRTTDFAVMYLPSESLYAEAMSIDGLSTKLRQDFNVVVGGPSIMAALLNSLQMGFRSLQIQKNSAEIRKAFDKFRKDFGKLNELLEKAKKKSEDVTKDIGSAIDRNDRIGSTLGKYAIATDEEEAAAAIDAPEGGDEG